MRPGCYSGPEWILVPTTRAGSVRGCAPASRTRTRYSRRVYRRRTIRIVARRSVVEAAMK